MNYNVRNLLYTGQLSNISGVPVQFPNNELLNGGIVVAWSGNVGDIFVGPTGVTSSNGFILSANAGSRFPVDNLSLLWVVGNSGTSSSLSWYGN